MTGAKLFERYQAENFTTSAFGGMNFERDFIAIESMLYDNYLIMQDRFTKVSEPLLIRLAFLIFDMEVLTKSGNLDQSQFTQKENLYNTLIAEAVATQTSKGGSQNGIKTIFIKKVKRC